MRLDPLGKILWPAWKGASPHAPATNTTVTDLDFRLCALSPANFTAAAAGFLRSTRVEKTDLVVH